MLVGAADIVATIAADAAVRATRIDARITVAVLWICTAQAARRMHAARLRVWPGAGACTVASIPVNATALGIHYVEQKIRMFHMSTQFSGTDNPHFGAVASRLTRRRQVSDCTYPNHNKTPTIG